MKLYKQKDLIDYTDDERVELASDATSVYSRKKALEKALPGAEVKVERTGGYSGDVYLVIETEDGTVWLVNDSYGSCSGCDSFQANQGKWLNRVLRSALGFDNKTDAVAYLLSENKGYDWSRANTEALIEKIFCEEGEEHEG